MGQKVGARGTEKDFMVNSVKTFYLFYGKLYF